ncbi:glycosyltransferase family 9 protein [Dissulfurirhabdus thermomarina]|uniref:Glycosyltransferase family 9 protein n=1 Tax=Dissulfurirhabdus thermomarina TaxID=1765737 RepID=A0A6N9TNH3_DISTH|nr:glycosyltransferase family 9 protein [Dissulfurirhabdus thermomarina]NDY41633.1 glycosyltransferase family 9 protein [Dissulfurirhabdus thermomarina]NMX23324.1 glycosyltransferase family 9 protein [Dissulfurirhabdus thermomarina]
MRILIVKLSALGDVVQALPVLAALRRAFPAAAVDWVVGEAAAGLLDGHPMLDRVIVYPRRRWGGAVRRPGRWPGLAGELRAFLRRLRAARYDVVLELQGLLKSGLVAAATRSPRKVGFAGGREGSSLFLTERLPPYDPDEHAVLRYLRLARHLGAPGGPPEFPLNAGPAAEREALDLLAAGGYHSPRHLVLVPGTVWPTKRWTPSGFARVAEFAARERGLLPVVVGGAGDRGLARAIRDEARVDVADLTGRTTLPQLAALFRRARAVVSTDTGPMHLAAAAGAPVVALFGPTAPWRTGPFGEGHVVVRRGLACSPCFRRRCADPRCMEEIGAAEVCAAVDRVLAAGAAAPGEGGIR